MKKTAALTIMTALFLLLANAGCGGPSEVRIGVIAEITGSLSAVGLSCKQGATLAETQINSSGGITVAGKKHKVDIIVRDCANKPAQAASLVEEMKEMDGVVAIVGPNATANAVVAADKAEAEGIVLVSPWSTSPLTTVTTSGKPKKDVYRTCVTAEYEGQQLAKFAKSDLGAATAAVIYDETAEVLKIQAQEFSDSFKAAGGTITAYEPFKPSEKDYSSQYQKIKAGAPAVLFVASYYNDTPLLLQQARTAGATSQFLGSNGWSSPEVIEKTGPPIEGSYVFNMYSPQMKDERTQQFVKAYQEKYSATPDDVAALSYDAVNLVREGVEKAEKLDPQAVAESMRKVKELQGATGGMRFTEASRNPIRGAVILKVVGDKFELFKQLYAKATKEDVVSIVESAVEFAKTKGKEAALAEFSNQQGQFNKGELYIFAYDFNGINLAHGGNKAFIGQDLINMKDPNGVMVIQELIKRAKNGKGWLDYMWENPQTGKVEPKVGYVMKVDDGWWLGSGIYTE